MSEVVNIAQAEAEKESLKSVFSQLRRVPREIP